MTRAGVHPNALVDPSARLGEGVGIGPFTVIGAEVEIGDGTVIGPHCSVHGPTRIGRDNRIVGHAAIGGDPQDKKYRGERVELEIGDRNLVREFVTINRGTGDGGGITRIGHDNWLLAYTHVAHDCRVGDHCVFSNNATLAGHVEVGDWATVGGLTGVLQRMRIGAHTMVGFASHVGKDVPPFMVVDGNPLAVRAVNLVGLRRRDFSAERLAAIRDMHKIIYRQGKTLDEARTAIQALAIDMPEAAADIALMDNFLGSSVSGIAR